MRAFLLCLLAFLYALKAYAAEGDILTLLKEYEKASDLSKKTKQESLGHIIVFTRRDLEVMQAYTLGDVLRLIPIYNFMPNQYGVETLMIPGRPIIVPFIFKLYIDDHEVSSLHTFNPFLIYDRYPLDNIDHIEVYYTAGAISVSTEPSQLIIKMYTKVAGRENASKLRMTGGTDRSYSLNFFTAQNIGESSCYLVSFGKSQLKFTEPEVNGQKINRDQFRENVFLKYRRKATQFEFSAVQLKQNMFTGLSLDKAPDLAKAVSVDSYVTVTHYFDSGLKATVSYDYQNRKYKEANKATDGGVYVPGFFSPMNPVVYYREDINFHKYALSFDQTFETKRNSLQIGTFFRYYRQHPENVVYRNSTGSYDITDTQFRVRNFYLASVYAEDSYSITDSIRVIAGIKQDKYKYYGQKSQSKTNLRAGVISFITENIMFKGFASYSYILPSLMLVEISARQKLNPVKVAILSGETRLTAGKNEFDFAVKYYKIRNYMTFTRLGIDNAEGQKIFKGYSFTFKRQLSRFVNLELNYWTVATGDFTFSPNKGGYGRISADFMRFTFYTDLVYKGSFNYSGKKVGEAFNLKMAVGYSFPKGWSLKVVGENLLNSSEKVAYRDASGNIGYFSVYPRRILFTIEKVF
ncbi:TonB-dependent receptor plug domain-containing protein [Persephonella sp.]